LFTAAIGQPSATRYKQSPSSVTVQCETDQARSRVIHRHSGRESCVWQQGSTFPEDNRKGSNCTDW